MTCIAFDGKTMAADKQSTDSGLRRSVTKIRRGNGGELIAAAGNSSMCRALVNWYLKGGLEADFPDKEKLAHLMVVYQNGSIWFFDGHHTPVQFESKQIAMGSGRDYAEAAMYLGKTAREAVEIASHFDCNCGMGIDALNLEPGVSSEPFFAAT